MIHSHTACDRAHSMLAFETALGLKVQADHSSAVSVSVAVAVAAD